MNPFEPLDADDIRWVSDAHFRSRTCPGEADRRDRFIRFLDAQPPGAVLILLGDVFDFYFEYRSVVSKRYFDLFVALDACRRRGVRLHFIGGNHDYWVGGFVSEELGIRVHEEEFAFEAQGHRIVCAHGDLIMPRDTGYKILKSILRNRAVIAVSRWLHPDLMDAIAGSVSKGSRELRNVHQKRRADAATEHAYRTFFDRGNDIFLMGHVHYPVHEVREGRHFVIVGDWISNFTYARMTGGNVSLETFSG